MFRPGDQAGAESRPAARASPLDAAPQDARPDPRLERSRHDAGRRRVRGAHQRLRPRVQDADRGAGGLRPREGAAGDARPVRHRRRSRPTTTAAAACWRAGWWRRACASSASSRAAGPATCSGTRTTTSKRTTCAWPPQTDQPVAALLKDLKRRGLLDSTLVVWGGEFGRSPEVAGRQGPRPPQPRLHACGWPAAASRAAQSSAPPTTSACKAIENPVHFRDIHTTILHQLGLDQDALSYLHQGRHERLTEVQGEVIKKMSPKNQLAADRRKSPSTRQASRILHIYETRHPHSPLSVQSVRNRTGTVVAQGGFDEGS